MGSRQIEDRKTSTHPHGAGVMNSPIRNTSKVVRNLTGVSSSQAKKFRVWRKWEGISRTIELDGSAPLLGVRHHGEKTRELNDEPSPSPLGVDVLMPVRRPVDGFVEAALQFGERAASVARQPVAAHLDRVLTGAPAPHLLLLESAAADSPENSPQLTALSRRDTDLRTERPPPRGSHIPAPRLKSQSSRFARTEGPACSRLEVSEVRQQTLTSTKRDHSGGNAAILVVHRHQLGGG